MTTRILPTNIQAECALLGAILASNKAFDLCGGLLPEHFADPANALIFQMAKRRIEAGRRVDAVTLKNALENTGALDAVGGTAYLTGLLTAMVAINNAGDYAKAIQSTFVQRGLIEVAKEIEDRAYGTDTDDNDPATTAAWGIEAIERAAAAGVGAAGGNMASAVAQAAKQADGAKRGERAAMGLMTGIPSLDEMWAGLYPGSLDIIGARPKTGKTALACQIARHVAREFRDQGEGCVGFLSLEMPMEHLGLVNLVSMTGIPADDIRRGRFDSEQRYKMFLAERELATLPIEIIDEPRIPLLKAIGALRTLKRTKGLRLVIADHRNLFGRDEEFRRATTLDWYANVTRRLKEAAKSLNVPVLCLIQIARGVEGRDDPRPRMSDLEYAGEQDADGILLLHRPALHMVEFPERKTGSPEAHANAQSAWYARRAELKNVAEGLFVKRRFGEGGIVKMKFTGPTTTFSDWPKEEVPVTDLWSNAND